MVQRPWPSRFPAPRAMALLLLGSLLILGCGTPEEAALTRRPRPVVSEVLEKRFAPNAALVTASAASWKTEDLGFEVAGRVEFVVEQNTEIDGRIRDSAGNLIIDGTPIAKLESERYELAVASAKSTVAQAEQELVVAQTDLDETIPARIDAAEASVELAKIEYDRNRRLREQNANSQSALDAAKADFENAAAELRQLIASEKSQKAQIESLKSAIRQAEQGLRDAVRDLEDCTLYSSFRGKVAETSVVPGSLVSAGAPVITLQMMDPIKVELEVSAEQSRKLQRADSLPIHVTMPDGSVEIHEGFLHQIDPSADPLTRTFTLTILVLNRQLAMNLEPDVATTRDIWRLDLPFIPGAKPGDLFVEEKAILFDDLGAYLWQVTNATIQSRSPSDQAFEVRKLRVTPEGVKVPYLGEFIFQKVTIDDESFDPSINIVIGELIVDGMPPEDWNGTQVMLDSPGSWMLRPGDLVKVDLSGGNGSAGYFVPMDAIARSGDRSYLFVVDSSGNASTVKRLPIQVGSITDKTTVSSLLQINPVDQQTSLDGIQYVTKGTHFLVDGEAVSVIVGGESGQ